MREILPRVALGLLILLLGWLAALICRAAVRGIVRGLRNRIPAGRVRAAWLDLIDEKRGEDVLAGGVYWTVIFLAAIVAAEALGFPILSTWLVAVASYLPKIVLALALAFGGLLGAKIAGDAVAQTAAHLAPRQAARLGKMTRVAIGLVALLVAADQLGLDTSLIRVVFIIVLASMMGATAIAFGLGARDVVVDILAMHYIGKSHRVGQIVRVGTIEGRIIQATATELVIESDEGEVVIPGRQLASSARIRLTRGERDAA